MATDPPPPSGEATHPANLPVAEDPDPLRQVDAALRLADLIPLRTVQALTKKARRGRLTASDMKTLAAAREELRELRGEIQGAAAAGDREIVRGAAALGKLKGVSERTVFRWIQGGMPYHPSPVGGEPSIFVLDEVDAWLVERGVGPGDEAEDPGQDDAGIPTDPKRRKLHYDAEFRAVKTELARMELRIKRGELVEAADVERRNVAKIIAAKRALQGVPAKVAMEIVQLLDVEAGRARDVATVVRREIDDAIRLHLGPVPEAPKAEPTERGVKDLPGQMLLFAEEELP